MCASFHRANRIVCVVAALLALMISAAWSATPDAATAKAEKQLVAHINGIPTPEFIERVDLVMNWITSVTREFTAVTRPSFLFIPSERINYLRYNLTERGYTGQEDAAALYYVENFVVVLSEEFRLGRDDFVLVHELFHHMVAVQGATFDCINAEEKMAYEMQNRWVKMTGVGWTAPKSYMIMLRCPPMR